MNIINISGCLTADPEYTKTNNGLSVAKFSVAVGRDYKNENGEYDTDFLNCVAWRGTADYCSKYLRKGNKVGICGSIQNRSYTGRDGSKKTVTEIIISKIESYTPKNTNNTKSQTQASKDQEVMQGFTPVDTDNLPF